MHRSQGNDATPWRVTAPDDPQPTDQTREDGPQHVLASVADFTA